jgi:membrane protein YdbS with pleckstrin-like domain
VDSGTEERVSYIDDHLLADERVVHRTRPHWIMFAGPLALAIAGLVLGIALQVFQRDYWYVGAAVIVLALVFAVAPWLRYISSEFAVTDKRVLARLGLIQRHSLETLLSKVEAIGVEQDLTGRLLGYGTVTLTGTGGTRERITRIPAPLEFRRQVQSQIVALETRRDPGSLVAQPDTTRRERECPYCAELILSRAKVCKHCGRDVQPV